MTFSYELYPHGLSCMCCQRVMQDGDAISKNLVGVHDETFVTETVCVLCPIEAALTA